MAAQKIAGRKRGVRLPKTYVGVSAGEVKDGLRYAPNHPLWKSMMAIIQATREEAVLLATDPELSEKEANMALGGVAQMDDLKAELEEQVRAAHREE